jgi:hypothetical protein
MAEMDEKEIIRCLEAISRLTAAPEVTARDLERARQRINEQANSNRSQSVSIWRTIMSKRLSKIAAVWVIVAGVVGMLAVLHQSSSIAFADVVRPILTAHNVIYTMTLGEKADGPVIHDMVMGTRIRRTASDSSDLTTIIDLETSKVLTLNRQEKLALCINLKDLPQVAPPNCLEKLRNIISEVQTNPEFVVGELGEQKLDGRPALGFRAKSPGAELTIWADPQTGQPIRIEHRENNLFIVCKDFQFDVQMDASLFSMQVPEGYTTKEVQLDLLGSTEEDFIESLRMLAETVFDGQFPPGIDIAAIQRLAPVIGRQIDNLKVSDTEKVASGMKFARGVTFIRFLKCEGKWYYAGNGVKLGDKDTAIFWYRPKGSSVYRVIYGDLTVKEVSSDDLPKPQEGTSEDAISAALMRYVDPANPRFVGEESDEWHITASGDITARSRIKLTAKPERASTMVVTLPYPDGRLKRVTVNGQAIPYPEGRKGQYELELPDELFASKEPTMEFIWSLPLNSLDRSESGYQTKLQALFPVTFYTLTVVLDPGCGFRCGEDGSQQQITPFRWRYDSPRMHLGSVGIPIQKQN